MGYRWPGTTYRLQFTDGRAAGLDVLCRAGSVGQLEAIGELDDLAEASPDQATARVTEVFAKSLVRWNLEDDEGTPVPATLEGLKTQEVEFVQLILRTWLDAQLARKREQEASAKDREVTDALAQFDHELIDHPV